MKRKEDCIIWDMFIDCKDRIKVINKYCHNNCQGKCLKNKEYKRREVRRDEKRQDYL